MGKEQDLLNAGKTGNVAQIEKILGHRGKKSGLQSIMGRSVNPNFQDEMGYTPLHYAALHGHRGAVELLLKYDASANIPDHSGNYPLHLAAFNGHADVCRILINCGPSRANVNEQNGTEDTAMHSAAQSKSSQVVAVLLGNHADPFIRNCRKESALDLAAQYGRMENVKQLLNHHPNLLQDQVKGHSPLHLAARNGHIEVVSNLLGCGMTVNTKCDTGTALHEAALFGKLDVCNFLLQCDIDITVKDKNQMTVMDLLMNHPSSKTKEISTLIYSHSQSKNRPWSIAKSSQVVTMSGLPTRSSTMIYRNSNYDEVPDPRPLSGVRRCDTYDSVPSPKSPKEFWSQMNYDTVPTPQQRPAQEVNLPEYVDARQELAAKPVITPSAVDGYSFITAPNQQSPPTTGNPLLSAQNVKDGYTMLGIPAAGTRLGGSPPKQKSGQNEIEEYSIIRQEAAQNISTSTQRSGVKDVTYSSKQEKNGEHTQDMLTKENKTYFHIDPHLGTQSPSNDQFPSASNGADYETVPSDPRKRNLDFPVYEIPPTMKQRQQPEPEGDYGLVGAAVAKPTKPIRHPKKFPSGPPLATSPPVYEIPPSFKSRTVETIEHERPNACPLDIPQYELVSLRNPVSSNQLGPETQALASSPGYEPMEPGESPPESFSEYEVLTPQKGGQGYGQYELVALPGAESRQVPPVPVSQVPPSSSIYEIAPIPKLVPPEPRPANPPSQAPPIYEIAPPPRPRAPPVPPSNSVPNVPMLTKEGDTIAPPRLRAPAAPPPNDVPVLSNEGDAVAPPPNSVPNVPMLIKEGDTAPPIVPRPYNQYQKFPVQPMVEPSPSAGKSGTYEIVRLEAPKKLNLDQIPTLPPRSFAGGDYCTLDPTAMGLILPPPVPPRDDISSGSSMGSVSGSDLADTPGVPPPSPNMAAQAVFEALEPRLQIIETITEKPEDDQKNNTPTGDTRTIPAPTGDTRAIPVPTGDTRPIPDPTRDTRSIPGLTEITRPIPAPRRESLNDKPKWYTRDPTSALESGNELQDPFSFPPEKETDDDEPLKLQREPENTSTFTSLHKKYSPFGSRENVTEEAGKTEPESAKEKVQSSPLLYENVLFKRSESVERTSVNKRPGTEAASMESKAKESSAETKPETELDDMSAPLDEVAEWEKIDALLLSIGEIEMPENTEDQLADAGNATTVPEWLKALGVGQYESDMMTNGFDELGFLNGGVLENQDLLDIGVEDPAHRKLILEATKKLLSPPCVTKMVNPPTSVEEWLKSLGLSEYTAVFLHHGYATIDRVKLIWEVELTSVLEINCLGHRNRILTSLSEPRRMTIVRKSRQSEVLDSKGNFGLDEKLAELNKFCPDEEPPEVIVGKVDGDMLMRIAEEMMKDERLKKKAEKKKKENQWRHDPEVLLKGCVNYSTSYLGSQTVKEIVGLASTVDACRKMRLSTAKLQKVPSVVLSVSVHGIKFIDARTRFVVSNHEMCNVSYITQDPEDKRIFAYIAKDAKIDRHYCHVFRVDYTELSDEITMSIGQAFELAYDQFMQIQVHLRNRTGQPSS